MFEAWVMGNVVANPVSISFLPVQVPRGYLSRNAQWSRHRRSFPPLVNWMSRPSWERIPPEVFFVVIGCGAGNRRQFKRQTPDNHLFGKRGD